MSSGAQKPSSSRSRRDKDDTNNPDINLPSIGNYVFQKTLGEGNFAKVKLAKHKMTGAEVAIKVIDKTQLDEKKLSKLNREVRIMKMLHHPHIVKLYEVIETKSTVFLVMEYCSGGELYDYLVVHGKMKEKEARAKFRQILSAVSYCHKKRVIHRDLKAENLLLDNNLNIKIADFGFSNWFDPDSKLDTFCGSPPYAAPELFQGRRYTGPEVDIWSLGVILYVLTTGCLPFDGKNLQEMRESVCRGKYRIPFYLSDTCEKLLRKFLIRDPGKRAGVEMLTDDPWINEGYSESPIEMDCSQKIEEDEALIRLIETKYQLPREQIVHSLRENIYDDIAAIYYLLYYEKNTRDKIEAEMLASPAIVQLPSPAEDKALGATATQHPPQHAPHAPTNHLSGRSTANDGSRGAAAGFGMTRIDEDGVLPSTTPAQPQTAAGATTPAAAAGANAASGNVDQVAPMPQRRQLQAKPRRRRFTVGGEADMAKYAEEDEEAAELLKKVQGGNTPTTVKDDTSRPTVGRTLPVRPSTAVDATELSTQNNTVPASANKSSVDSTEATDSGSNMNTPMSPNAADGHHQRKRHNTIVGILRNSIRRTSDVMSAVSPTADKGGDMLGSNAQYTTAAAMASTSISGSQGGTDGIGSMGAVKPGEENKPRSLRFTFNSNTTSSKPPDEIVQEVVNACNKHGISHRLTSRFLIECFWASPPAPTKDGVKFEIEICKLPRLKNLHGLRFKRVSGTSADYKDVCEKILNSVAL
ncbi:Serine/threonine-protein kinase par-1 [Quaeritorhiza haematococci]|nr:Serine/threonine-protein kinase par-1 [Quaeritorhiza haematococci]